MISQRLEVRRGVGEPGFPLLGAWVKAAPVGKIVGSTANSSEQESTQPR